MKGSNANRKRRLEIIDKIDYLEERMCIFPSFREDARRDIDRLVDELKQLESENRMQTENVEMN